jgi:DnaJ-class molecular chaperone
VPSVEKMSTIVTSMKDLEENVSGKQSLSGEEGMTKDWDRENRQKHSRQSKDQAESLQRLPRTARCSKCKGLGVKKGTQEVCPACKGDGGIYLGNV